MIDTNIKKEREKKEIKVEVLTDVSNFKIEKDFALYLEIYGDNYHKDKPLGVGIYNDDLNVFIPFEVLKNNPNLLKTDANMCTYDLKKVL